MNQKQHETLLNKTSLVQHRNQLTDEKFVIGIMIVLAVVLVINYSNTSAKQQNILEWSAPKLNTTRPYCYESNKPRPTGYTIRCCNQKTCIDVVWNDIGAGFYTYHCEDTTSYEQTNCKLV